MPQVAPFTGAWIEITGPWKSSTAAAVAPFTGAWIEIFVTGTGEVDDGVGVAPFTGAWIEICFYDTIKAVWRGRTLHGCVD